MKLNKMGIILLAGLFLYGCAPSADMEPESYFSISDDKDSYYNAIIEDTLNSFYWRYDSDSIYSVSYTHLIQSISSMAAFQLVYLRVSIGNSFERDVYKRQLRQ